MRTIVSNINDDKDFLSWGDYQCWHLEYLRNAIIKRYGKQAVGELQRNERGFLCLPYDNNIVKMALIGKDIGVHVSRPSTSSTSSHADVGG